MTIKYVAVIVSKNGTVLHKGDAYVTQKQATVMAVRDYTQTAPPVADYTRLGKAIAFIKTELHDGRKSAADLRRNAEGAGLTWATVRRALQKLGAVSKKGVGSQAAPWFWSLPSPQT
jgi:hypothetical protein